MSNFLLLSQITDNSKAALSIVNVTSVSSGFFNYHQKAGFVNNKFEHENLRTFGSFMIY